MSVVSSAILTCAVVYDNDADDSWLLLCLINAYDAV